MATPAVLAEDRRPALSRRHAVGAASARGLLFTVLGEFVLPTGGSAWTSAFIEVFGRLGVEEKAIRQALARTAADGWIVPERHGRRTRWRLTHDGDRLLTEGTERIYAFAGPQRGWDGSWLLVLARVPEADRSARHLLRTRLHWAGLGSPAPGVWITTHTERKEEVERVLRQAGVTDGQVFVAGHTGGDLAALVAGAWDLPAIERHYEEFLAEFAPAATPDPLVRLTELVHAWRRFPAIDPGLPSRLLPSRWSGARAARLFAARHAKWSPDAVARWARLNLCGAAVGADVLRVPAFSHAGRAGQPRRAMGAHRLARPLLCHTPRRQPRSAKGTPPMRIALFITCLTDTLFPETGKAVVGLLERLGHQVEFPQSQTCCGQMHFNTGYRRESLPMVRGFAGAFSGFDAIVSPSASCASMVREYHGQLAEEAGEAALARAVASVAPRVHDLSTLLTDVLGVTDVGAYFPHRVTYHPTCHSLRMLRAGDAPLRLLRAVRGIDLVDLPAAESCCGFGGTFSVKNPDVSAAMCADKVAAVKQAQAEVLCAADNSCLMHIGGALTRQRAGIATMHLAEILASTQEQPAAVRGHHREAAR